MKVIVINSLIQIHIYLYHKVFEILAILRQELIDTYLLYYLGIFELKLSLCIIYVSFKPKCECGPSRLCLF